MDTTPDPAAPCTACLRYACRCDAPGTIPPQDRADALPEPYVWMPWSAGVAANA